MFYQQINIYLVLIRTLSSTGPFERNILKQIVKHSLNDFIGENYFYKLFISLGPDPGGQVGPLLPQLSEGVHRGALLVVPEPAEVGGEGAGGGPPVGVLHVPQLEDLLGDVFELVERSQVKL